MNLMDNGQELNMGFLSGLFNSVSKSKKLVRLQTELCGSEQIDIRTMSITDIEKSMVRAMENAASSTAVDSTTRRERALEEYIDMCMSENKVLVEYYNITRSDMSDIAELLSKEGLYGKERGHWMHLSTIAYGEPLLYFLKARQNNISIKEVAYALIDYWSSGVSLRPRIDKLL